MPSTQSLRVAAIVLLTLSLISIALAASFPVGFNDTLIASLPDPVALAAIPDGRLLVTTQEGKLRVIQDGTMLPEPALDLSAVTCSDKERGMLGIAVDPDFARNRFIYVYYTFDKFGTKANPNLPDCPRQSRPNKPVNRLSRFVLADNSRADPASETVLLDNIFSINANHDGGGLRFGNDGYLYIATGDAGCDYASPDKCQGSNDSSRDMNTLNGKILRITTSGGIPPTNPYRGSNSARCYDPAPGGNKEGMTTPDKFCQEAFAVGLRNPFRMAFDPNAAKTRFFINDVGQNTVEEINEGIAGADYGWNCYEGDRLFNTSGPCTSPPPLTPPIYTYDHTTGCKSVTAAAFIPNGIWPPEYDDAYLFSDYTCGKSFMLKQAPDGSYQATEFTPDGVYGVDMVFAPYQGTQALYYITHNSEAEPAFFGEIRRLVYTGATNRLPTAHLSANRTSGPTPLTISFDGTGSSDPDQEQLTYLWNFGDGTSSETSAPAIEHTYTTPGVYTASLVVRDSRGASSTNPATLRIDVGNTAPTPSISSPAADDSYRVGQSLLLAGSASDPEDGVLPDSALTWRVLIHHNDHTHPYIPLTTGNNLTIEMPPPEDLFATANSYLVVYLTAQDANGATTTITQSVQPQRVTLTFASHPPGLRLGLDGGTAGNSITTPHELVSWVGYRLELSAPPSQSLDGENYSFCGWSHGGPAAQSYVTPAQNWTVTAVYQPAALGCPANVSLPALNLPLLRR